jgi:hypothetical protein
MIYQQAVLSPVSVDAVHHQESVLFRSSGIDPLNIQPDRVYRRRRAESDSQWFYLRL